MVLHVNVLTSEFCTTAITVLLITDRKLPINIQRSPITEHRTHFQQKWYIQRALVAINVSSIFLLNAG
jgi:hypothetical protein